MSELRITRRSSEGVVSVQPFRPHPDPATNEVRAVGHAKRLARASAVGCDGAVFVVMAVDENNRDTIIYNSPHDRDLAGFWGTYPIRKDRPYVKADR
jgi:hypothetical protein